MVELKAGPASAPLGERPRHGMGRRLVAAAVILMIGWLLAVQAWNVLYGPLRSGPWVPAGTLERIREARVVYVPEANAYVVAEAHGAIALSAASPHAGERLRWCTTSGWFESPAHGEKFDSDGTYADGPAPTGMDRVPVRLRDGVVEVRRDGVGEGAPRGFGRLDPPAGAFCTT